MIEERFSYERILFETSERESKLGGMEKEFELDFSFSFVIPLKKMCFVRILKKKETAIFWQNISILCVFRFSLDKQSLEWMIMNVLRY